MRVLVEGFGPLADGVRRACDEHHMLGEPCDLYVIAHEGDDRHLVDKSVRNAPTRALVLILTPIASGTTRRLESAYDRPVIYAPENVRSATAYEDFIDQARIVVGCGWTTSETEAVERFFAPFTSCILRMSPEDAEMAKHALNGFLAISVAYGNEIGRLCDAYGVNSANVVGALKSDPRIGERAYLEPGGPYGKNLAREIDHLIELGVGPMVRAARESNRL